MSTFIRRQRRRRRKRTFPFFFLVKLQLGFSIPKNILISPFYSWNPFRSAFISLHLHQGTVFFSFNSSFGVGLGF
ncbi:hypothetical protein Gohar_021834 [Gossypium harknessii]|uniref:Uncharacterized protein n=1 Tax=Gossypium harknessii TaxID=34285 RepID=A0A7J9I9S0_9ROSI|nr:hypothetical protein [Gossypium harknessii]